MRIYPNLLLAAVASLAAPLIAQSAGAIAGDPGSTLGQVKRRRALPVGHVQGARRLRSRWKASRPKRHSNRLHISKRARRKHRRAA